ncbi:MAG TPA: hypothetical protein VG900_07690 [Hyphomicrobiaceae bacterium]|nr:hypothetical protein [Hyphomicrobiaceae bacterium]
MQAARTGTPSAKGAPAWPRHTRTQDRTLKIGDDIAVEKRFMRARLGVLIRAGAVLRRVQRRK